LLKAIEPIWVNCLNAGSKAQAAEGSTIGRYAPDPKPISDLPDPEIGSIHYRAQEVKAGGMFVAIEGQTADGHNFIYQALERGAAAIVSQKELDPTRLKVTDAGMAASGSIVVRVADTRKALADLSARIYGNPSEHMTLIGITGTNGKTTVAYIIESILLKAGFNTGVIGTINYRYGGNIFSNPMTTPESLDLQRILSEMRQHGTTHVVMEASSHGVDLHRIKSCWFDVAVFTNLSQDHLDFHGDMESYWSSKKRFFTELLNQGPKKETAVAVINCDDEKGLELLQMLTRPIVKTGADSVCEIRAENFHCDFSGTAGRVATPEGRFNFKTPLVGAHNVQNILSATGAGVALNIPADTIKAGIESITAIPGRLESIVNSTGRFVYVDYAHTPDALENSISALQGIAPARIICVFGCGGDRDKKKRPLMGEIVAHRCDLSIVTSDNPRTEDPMSIIRQILPGTKQANGVEYSPEDIKFGFKKKGYVVEPDRRRAIEIGITVSRPGDVVLIAGKGHEPYQIIGKKTISFDDREEARRALRAVEVE
jgi:UDP-N-acetylmuramoyl-L-alanyl-D-glutamate--2,6-diaminopimelate ligase/murE/murF fusion protein